MNAARSVADRVAAAKLWLISEPTAAADPPRDLPYLATAVYALVLVPSTDVATMTVDEHWRLYANPAWVLGASTPQVGAELAHLVWHLLLDHADRARALGVGAGEARSWKTATDMTIEHTTAPDGVLADSVRETAERAGHGSRVGDLGSGRAAEEYYAVLSRLPARPSGADRDVEPLPGCGSGCDGLPRSHELPPDADPGFIDAVDARQIRVAVAVDYRGHVTGRGHRPGDADRWARSITEPEVPWESLLARAVRQAVGWTNGRTDYTWTRPSRRQSAVPHVFLPGRRRPSPTVASVVDTSASVDDTLLGKALGEVDGVLRAIGVAGSSVSVYACDAAVGAVSRVRRARDARMAGGGGTDLRVGIAAAASARPRPHLLVVFTDGYTPWPEQPPPGVAMVAAMLGRAGDPLPPTPDWATRVECVLH